MNDTSNIKKQIASPLLNFAIAAVLLFTALPIALFGAMQIVPPISDATEKNEAVEDTATKRISTTERRARRKETREAKRALAKNTPDTGESAMQYHLRTVHNIIISKEGYEYPGFVDYPDGFGPGNDIERMFPGAMGRFGFGPGADM